MKLGRNIGSVTIPKRPSTVGGLIGWARGVNKTLQELRDRKVAFVSARKPGTGKHPFEIVVLNIEGVNRLYVSWGIVSAMRWTSGQNMPHISELPCTFSGGSLLNAPGGNIATSGYEEMAESTTYGVWLAVAISAGNVSNPFSENPTFTIKRIGTSGSDCGIAISTDYTNSDDGEDFAVAEGNVWGFYYIGSAYSGIGTDFAINQWRKSDIVVPMTTLPSAIKVVSTDANNDITAGADGGAFYDAP